MARYDDEDSLGYFARRGFEEMGRMQDVRLELSDVTVGPTAPAGIQIAPMREEDERGMYEVSLEAYADIPSAVPIQSGTFEQWRERQLSALVLRPLSFVALEQGRVVGFAILGGDREGMADHWMTGVARRARPPRCSCAQAGADRRCEGRRPENAPNDERSRQRADAACERKARLRAENRVGPPRWPAARRLMP